MTPSKRSALFLLLTLGTCSRAEFIETVDFIVVGGGVGGCTVASRLSENGKFTVALLEAGGFPDPQLEIPGTSSLLLGQQREDTVLYNVVPQRDAGLDNNGSIPYIAGKGLGGGSSKNFMMFTRGSPNDFNHWAQLAGDITWSYNYMLRHFKKSEDYQGEHPSDHHGYGGPITVSKPKYAPGLTPYLEAGKQLGYPVGDANGPQIVGFSAVEFSKKFGRRVSAYTGYIQPYLNSRRNLQVIINAHVSRIIFKEKHAVGVKFSTNSSGSEEMRTIWARKEVIVAAGVFESPALLMRSGIGPYMVLNQTGIPIVKDLPVGRNLQNHLTVRMHFIINDTSQVFLRKRDLTPDTLDQWKETGDGPYSSWHGLSGQAFLETGFVKKNVYPGGWADVQFVPFNTPEVPNLIPARENVSMKPGEVGTISLVVLSRPKSFGSVTLNTSNVDGPLIVDFRYLTHPLDLDTLVAGVKLMLKVYEDTKAFKELGARYPTEPWPSCKQHKFRSDDYWRCVVRQTTTAPSHGAGTCRMGYGEADPRAVVDTKLRVLGIQGLRVVDASVMPTVINANLQAAIYAIAEKASDMILRRWKTPGKKRKAPQQTPNTNQTLTF